MAEQTPYNLIIKPAGAQCNLACDYCFFLKKERLYPGSSFRMDEDTLAHFIRQYLHSLPDGEAFFTWQGGEPTLMGIPFFKKVLALQQQYRRAGQTVLNAIQTNGLLLDDDWGAFLHDHTFLAGLSLDGPAAYHDTYRKSRSGAGSHALALRGLEVLKKHKVETNILACVSAANVHDPLGTYRYLRDTLEMHHMQFIPIVERDNASGNQAGHRLSARSISGADWGAFLIAVFDEWVQHDVGAVFMQLFEVCLGVWLGYPAGLCIFSPTCGSCLALEHTGDLYACDHYVQPDKLLGNLNKQDLSSMVTSPAQRRFGQDKLDKLTRQCLRCEVRFMCNGDCPKNRILPAIKGDAPLSHLCEGYYALFKHIDQPMKTMAALVRAGKPAAEIMKMR